MSSYLEATFRPRAAQPGEVTLLIPNIFNPSETLPVHVKKEHLFHLYMSLFGDPDKDVQQQQEQDQPYLPPDTNLGRTNRNIRAEW